MSRELRQKFGGRVRELREERGISLRQFAMQINADKTFISGVERGERSATLDTIEKIAKGLGVSISELFYGL